MNIDGIEQGVSLYGFNQRWVEDRDYTIRRAIEDVRALGVEKYELVGAVFFDEYPRPGSAEIDEVLAVNDATGAVPFSYGGYLDTGAITGHTPNDDDVVFSLTADLMTARELGCEYLRMGTLPVNLLPLVGMFAEQYGVKIGMEVHAPSKPSDANIQALLAELDRLENPNLGFIPDFGCFVERPAAPALDRYVREGASAELLEFVIANRHAGYTEQELWSEVESRGGGTAERMAVADFFGYLSFGPADVEGFRTLLPWTHYFHSKFYHVTEQLEDLTIPLPQLLDAIADASFQGVLLSEYEGHAFHNDDAEEQLQRHLLLEQRILQGRMP